MEPQQRASGQLHFTLAGIPTTIHPSSWLVLLVLGSTSGTKGYDLLPTLIFVVAGMLCILAHEYGHAFTCRAFGGHVVGIQIASLGGVTHMAPPPRTRLGDIITTLAGPLASLCLGALGGLLLGLHIGNPVEGISYALQAPLEALLPGVHPQLHFEDLYRAVFSGSLSIEVLMCYRTLFFVCVWWSILNLLPILPLDGGHIVHRITGNTVLTGRISIVTAVLLGVICFVRLEFFLCLFCAYAVYMNMQYLKNTPR